MAKSVIVWQCITILCYILQPICTGTTHTSKACYGNPALSCAQHAISCNSTQKIAIYDAYYTNNNECGQGLSSCTVKPDSVTERGHRRFNNAELASLYNNCSRETQCVYSAPRRREVLAFSVVKYQCIENDDSLSISGGFAQGLSLVSLTHNQRMHNSTIQSDNYTCRFKPNVTAACISVFALDARLERETQRQCLSQLSVLPGNVIATNNCSTVFQPFEKLNVKAQLPVSLHFPDIPSPSSILTWLLINASGPFNVKCETETVTSTGTNTGITVDHVSSTKDSSCVSTEYSTKTTVIKIVSSETRDNGTHTAEERGNNTGAIIGGVVGTAVLVVTLVSVVLMRKRYIRVKGEGKEKTATFPLDVEPDTKYSLAGKIPQNNYHEIQDLKTQGSDYDYANADGLADPPNAHTYFTIEPAGKQNIKLSSTSSPTECDYDHIGDKQSPQTSDYDTTASVDQHAHTGGTIGEDDYGYNLFHKKTNPQIHQNDYDTAASATKAVAQLDRTDRNTDDDDYDHFPSVTNHPETVSSPYDTASEMGHN